MADEYLVNIVLKARDEGMKAFTEMGTALAAMVAEAKVANEELKRLNETTTEHGNALHNLNLDTQRTASEVGRLASDLESKLTPAMNNANRAAGNNGGAASGLMAFVQGAIPGGQTAGNIAIGVAAAAAAFAPFTAELAASLILLGAWVVGATAFLAVIGIAAAGVLALAGGIAFLGLQQMGGINPAAALTAAQTKLTTAINQTEAAQEAVRLAQLRYDARPTAVNLQILKDVQEQLIETQKKQVDAQNAVNVATTNANGPMATLRQSISDMATTLGQAAVPMTTQMLNALIPLVPQVQAAGQSLIDWFGPRLPAVLLIAQQAFGNLLAGLQRVAEGWGQLIDHVLARSPEFGNIINGAFNRVIDGVLGLMDNLVRLSDWFVERLPTLGANANATFANLGFIVQGLGFALGHLVDWVIAHWPAINAAFNTSWDAFKQGWATIQPIFGLFTASLQALQPLFLYIEQHADNLKVIYWALGAAAAIVVAALGAIFLIAVLLTGAIVGLSDAIHGNLDALHSMATSLGNSWNTAKDTVGKALDAIIGKHATTARSAKDAATDVATATGNIKTAWSGAAGPGAGSIDESTTRINNAVAGIGGPSATTASQTHTDTGNMATDYGNLASGAEYSGARMRADNEKTKKSTDDTSTGLTAAWAWVTKNVGQSNKENEIAFGDLRYWIDRTMKDNIGAIDGFFKEHGIKSRAVDYTNTVTTKVFKDTSYWIGRSMSDNGSFVDWFRKQNESHSASIERDNRQQGVNWRELSRIIGKSTDENGQFMSDMGTKAKALGDLTDFVIFKMIGPAFSNMGSGARVLEGIIGQVFNALAPAVVGGLNAVIGAYDTFADLVNGALGGFGVHLKHVNPFGSGGNPGATQPGGFSAFAEGGVVPGYAPGQDSVPAMLSPGEGVLTPQTVRAMGGESAIKALNASQGATDMGGIAATIGAIGGQCVEFLQNLLGLTYHGNANTWVNAPYAHTQTGAPGMLAVFTAGMYGHLALVTKMITDSIFDVLDSNWVAPGVIGAHTMSKSMYGFATFLNPGISAPGGLGQFLSGIPGITSPADLLNGLVSKALGGLGGWEGDLAKGILGQAVTGITHSLGFDSGGGLPPGGTFAWNGTGRTETVTPASTMDKVEALLSSIDSRLAAIAGQPRLSPGSAGRMFS